MERNNMEFRKSTMADIDAQMKIVNDAKQLLKSQNIDQWQYGDPSRQRIELDAKEGVGYVLCDGDKILGTCAITYGADKNYTSIDGKWQTSDDNYATVHRMAVAADSHGLGLGVEIYRQVEILAKSLNMTSVRADTHHHNIAMQKTMLKSAHSTAKNATRQRSAPSKRGAATA